MTDAIIVALITAAATIIAQLIISARNRAEVDNKLDKQQAVMEVRLEELTREVRTHNNFAQRVPVMEEQIRVANHRISDLEAEHEKKS